MNVLYIAYSCDPYKGSEDKIGWNIPVQNAQINKVFVITKEEQRTSIENYLTKHTLKNIKFIYVDISPFYKKIFRGFLYSARLNIWHKKVFSLAEKLCREEAIDIIHQITPVEYRAIGNYGKIENIKFVCGPVGGGEFIPAGLRVYACRQQFIELVRRIANYWYRYKLKTSQTLKTCDYLMFANRETQQFVNGNDVENRLESDNIFTEIGLGNQELQQKRKSPKEWTECPVILVAGRLVYRKGHKFLLEALKQVPDKLNYMCHIVGDGPERKRLQRYCLNDAKLSSHVVFEGKVSYDDMVHKYKKADIFVLPSIRETTGTVLLEAMSNELPIITMDSFGGAELLDESMGWFYKGTNRCEYISNLAQVLIECLQNPGEREERGYNARKGAEKHTWINKTQYYETIYEKLLEH